MKNILLATLMAIISPSVEAQTSNQVTVPLSSPGKIGLLETDIKSASIKVTGSNRSDILVKYLLIEKTDDEEEDYELRGGLKKIKTNNFDLEISEDKNTISIKSESWFQQIELEIEVPINFNLDLHNYTGRFIEVQNISGDINLESYAGTITAKGVSGTVNASTYAGKIEVVFNQITPDQSMAFSNYSGTIDLTLPANYKATFKMKTTFSEVYSAFDMNVVSKPAELKKTEGKTFKLSTDDWTVGSINGGGPEIMIKNFSGGIYLRKA
jgi:hypothetical protein